jgi:hypothetical protein
MLDENVIRLAAAQEKRRAEEQFALARLSGADARLKILAATIEAFRRSGWSNEEIVKMLRFAIDVLEGREN